MTSDLTSAKPLIPGDADPRNRSCMRLRIGAMTVLGYSKCSHWKGKNMGKIWENMGKYGFGGTLFSNKATSTSAISQKPSTENFRKISPVAMLFVTWPSGPGTPRSRQSEGSYNTARTQAFQAWSWRVAAQIGWGTWDTWDTIGPKDQSCRQVWALFKVGSGELWAERLCERFFVHWDNIPILFISNIIYIYIYIISHSRGCHWPHPISPSQGTLPRQQSMHGCMAPVPAVPGWRWTPNSWSVGSLEPTARRSGSELGREEVERAERRRHETMATKMALDGMYSRYSSSTLKSMRILLWSSVGLGWNLLCSIRGAKDFETAQNNKSRHGFFWSPRSTESNGLFVPAISCLLQHLVRSSHIQRGGLGGCFEVGQGHNTSPYSLAHTLILSIKCQKKIRHVVTPMPWTTTMWRWFVPTISGTDMTDMDGLFIGQTTLQYQVAGKVGSLLWPLLSMRHNVGEWHVWGSNILVQTSVSNWSSNEALSHLNHRSLNGNWSIFRTNKGSFKWRDPPVIFTDVLSERQTRGDPLSGCHTHKWRHLGRWTPGGSHRWSNTPPSPQWRQPTFLFWPKKKTRGSSSIPIPSGKLT